MKITDWLREYYLEYFSNKGLLVKFIVVAGYLEAMGYSP